MGELLLYERNIFLLYLNLELYTTVTPLQEIKY